MGRKKKKRNKRKIEDRSYNVKLLAFKAFMFGVFVSFVYALFKKHTSNSLMTSPFAVNRMCINTRTSNHVFNDCVETPISINEYNKGATKKDMETKLIKIIKEHSRNTNGDIIINMKIINELCIREDIANILKQINERNKGEKKLLALYKKAINSDGKMKCEITNIETIKGEEIGEMDVKLLNKQQAEKKLDIELEKELNIKSDKKKSHEHVSSLTRGRGK